MRTTDTAPITFEIIDDSAQRAAERAQRIKDGNDRAVRDACARAREATR